VGQSQESNLIKPDGFIGSSVSAYKHIYPIVVKAIENGGASVEYIDYDTTPPKPKPRINTRHWGL